MSRLAFLVVLVACSSKPAPPPNLDCKAFADHLESLVKQSIAEMPDDKRAAAEARMTEQNPAAREKLIAGCKDSYERKPGSYDCMMRATTLRAFKACDQS